jgi:lysozyme family protein
MRANFQPSLAFTLGFERGKVDHPKDPGGRTNRGITQRTYDAHRDSKGQHGSTFI